MYLKKFKRWAVLLCISLLLVCEYPMHQEVPGSWIFLSELISSCFLSHLSDCMNFKYLLAREWYAEMTGWRKEKNYWKAEVSKLGSLLKINPFPEKKLHPVMLKSVWYNRVTGWQILCFSAIMNRTYKKPKTNKQKIYYCDYFSCDWKG